MRIAAAVLMIALADLAAAQSSGYAQVRPLLFNDVYT
jgi:hypothetical protein